MLPITEDQEWTLRNWAVACGKRPGKDAIAFLQKDKGLSKDQINHWWKAFESEQREQLQAEIMWRLC